MKPKERAKSTPLVKYIQKLWVSPPKCMNPIPTWDAIDIPICGGGGDKLPKENVLAWTFLYNRRHELTIVILLDYVELCSHCYDTDPNCNHDHKTVDDVHVYFRRDNHEKMSWSITENDSLGQKGINFLNGISANIMEMAKDPQIGQFGTPIRTVKLDW